MTRVSVIVPTRNRSTLLTTTLRSVLWQRDVDLEVIVVDEGSSDDTPEVIARLADPRLVSVRHSVPQGLSAARNTGASVAQGEWVGFVDDDDVWAPEKIRRQVVAAEETGLNWVYVGTVNVGMDLEIMSGTPPPSAAEVVAALPRYNPIPGGGSNVILRRSLLEQVGGFDERFTACEDWEMWARLARTGPPACVSCPLMGYRLHSGSMSLDTIRIRRNAELIEQLHATTVDWGRLHRWLAESCLRSERHMAALRQFLSAVVHGQAIGVACDLAAILRRRLARHLGGHPAADRAVGRTWRGAAVTWLRELERCASASVVEDGRRPLA
jgi:GT2 family glycosyltransferase